jgi:hypothetical protein
MKKNNGTFIVPQDTSALQEDSSILEPTGKYGSLIRFIEGRGRSAGYDEVIEYARRYSAIAELQILFTHSHIVPAGGYFLTARDVFKVIEGLHHEKPGISFTDEIISEVMNEPVLSVAIAMQALIDAGCVRSTESLARGAA